jgi:hypothetical protein
MRVTLWITKKEIEHIKEHTFHDSCNVVEDIMKKIQVRVKNVKV